MEKQGKTALPVAFFSAIFFTLASSQTLPTGVTLVPFYNTVQVSFVRDSVRTVGMWEVPGKPQHFFVLDQMGAIYSLYPDTTKTYAAGAIKDYTKATLANFKSKVKHNLRSEMGAWSLAFHPNFQQNRYFYVMYFGYSATPSDVLRTDGYVNVERWIVNADYRGVTRDTTIYSFYHQASYGVSSIAFGQDGYLYMGTSVYSENGWDTTTVARKILRIDVDHQDAGKMYAIPPTNPYYNSTNANIKKEVFASGLRNVWSMSFDFQTGALWAGDVGQDGSEEINIIQPGKNYGWANGGNSEPSANGVGVQGPCPTGFSYTGTLSGNRTVTCADLTNPDWNFPHGTGTNQMYCIVMGPAFRGDPSSPFYGYHFVSDVWTNRFWAVKEGAAGARPAPQVVGGSPTTITTNNDGHNGIVNIAEDAYGNLYTSMVSWYFSGTIGTTTNGLPGGQQMFHELYRLSHAQLTPRTTAATSVWGSPYAKVGDKSRRLMMNAMAGSQLEIPAAYSGAELYNLRGKMVWSAKSLGGGQSKVRIPREVEKGVLQVRFLP